MAEAEAGLVVGGHLARELGVPNRAILGLTSILRAEMSAFTSQLALSLAASSEAPSETAWIFKFDQGKAPAFTDDPISPDVPLMLGEVAQLCMCAACGCCGWVGAIQQGRANGIA